MEDFNFLFLSFKEVCNCVVFSFYEEIYIVQSLPKRGVSVIIVSVDPNQVCDLRKAFSLGDVFIP